MAVNNTGKQKQHKHKDGRERLGSGTHRSLAWLLILSSKTETMKWLGLNLYVVGCRAARRSWLSSETPSSNLAMRCGVFSLGHIRLLSTTFCQRFICYSCAILLASFMDSEVRVANSKSCWISFSTKTAQIRKLFFFFSPSNVWCICVLIGSMMEN